MLAKVLRFDPDRRRRARAPEMGPSRPPEEASGHLDVVPPADDDDKPRGLLSLVSVRILRDDDDTDF